MTLKRKKFRKIYWYNISIYDIDRCYYDFSHLIDKDEGDESCKILLCKSSDVTDASTRVKSHEDE